jgi:arylsulfatase A
LPTLFSAAKAKVPTGYVTDGVDMTPLFGGGKIRPRPLYWYHPFYDVRWLCTPNAVVRDGDLKLIEYFGDYLDEAKGAEYVLGRRLELYNLREDVGETKN